MNNTNKHGTAVKVGSVWYISKNWYYQWLMEFTDVRFEGFRDYGVLGEVTSPWVGELLTKKDRKILREARDCGVFKVVWVELDKIRSEQYSKLLEARSVATDMNAASLIEEVRRNG